MLHFFCSVFTGSTQYVVWTTTWVCLRLRLSLLQSAAHSAAIEKAEPCWPIQLRPWALTQLKMNSLNLQRRELQSWPRANRDPVTRARLNLLNMKPNLGINLLSSRKWVYFPQQITFLQAISRSDWFTAAPACWTRLKTNLPYTFTVMFSQNWSTKHGSGKWMPSSCPHRWIQSRGHGTTGSSYCIMSWHCRPTS